MAGIASLTACNDDDWSKGNPTMGVKTDLGTACFGDSLRFTINASDSEVPLSTLRRDGEREGDPHKKEW